MLAKRKRNIRLPWPTLLIASLVLLVVLVLVFVMREPTRRLLKVEDYQKPIEEISRNFVADFDCNADLGQALESNQNVTFERDDWEVSLDVPFNDSWGGEKYKLLPYEVVDTTYAPGVYLGPVKSGTAPHCGFFRYYYLSKSEQMSVQSFIDGLKKYHNWSPDADYNELRSLPKVEKVNGVTLASYQLGGRCLTSRVMIFGEESNYLLEGHCESFAEMEDLLEIARTVEMK